MIPTLLVKAEVVDIRNRKSNLPKRVVADANVLYVINYDFTGLAAAGGRVPPSYQTRHYPAWWKRAAQGGVELCTTASCLAEFAHIVERTELENLWRTDRIGRNWTRIGQVRISHPSTRRPSATTIMARLSRSGKAWERHSPLLERTSHSSTGRSGRGSPEPGDPTVG